MKKIIALLLVMALAYSAVSVSFAEEEQKSRGFFGSVGSFFSDTWSDASGWIEGAWKDTTQWLDGAWGDASKWVEQAWNDSSSWVSDIWGDASGWASDTVSTWWTKTFKTVTKDSQNIWTWVQDKSDSLKTKGSDILENAKDAIAAAGDSAEEKVRETILVLLDKLGIQEAEAGKVWDTIQAYAEQKGISTLAAAKLSVPYLMQLWMESTEQSNGSIPAVAVAQYLTGVIEKLKIKDNVDANELISQLNNVLADI